MGGTPSSSGPGAAGCRRLPGQASLVDKGAQAGGQNPTPVTAAGRTGVLPRRPHVPPAAGPASPQPTLCPLPRHRRDSMNPCPRPPVAVLGLHPSVLTALNPTAPGLCRGPSAFPPQPEGRSPGQATEPGPEGTRDRAARDTPLGPGSGRVGGAGSEETGWVTWAEHKNQGPVIDSEPSTQTQ